MNKLPGFTAEAALETHRSGHYMATAMHADATFGSVVPQACSDQATRNCSVLGMACCTKIEGGRVVEYCC